MNNNDILKRGELFLRVLSIHNDDVLVINCSTREMPYITKKECLKGFCQITQQELLDGLKITLKPILMMNNDELKQMQEIYDIISPILSFLDDSFDRQDMIEKVARKNDLSQKTIRKYLKTYLVFQDKSCLLKRSIKKEKELSDDEKNFRYILNKYFYTSSKRSLNCAYLYLLREKYTDENGKLVEDYPPFHRFKYFYYKNRNYDNYLISRETKSKYLRDHRPLLGDTKSFFSSIGVGECDSTIADIWVLDDYNNLIGRPHITAMICPFSHMLLGYTIGFDNSVDSLRKLILDVNSRGYGIPSHLYTDRGKEYLSSTFSNLTDLGIKITSLRPYNPSDKGEIEKFFDIIQGYFKPYLINKGIVRENAGLRGAPDYRTQATITFDEFKKIMEICVEHFNKKRLVDVPYKYIDIVKPYAENIFQKDYEFHKDSFINVSNELLEKTLLPRTYGSFSRNGLIVNKLRYRAFGFINDYLLGSKNELIAYDPLNVSYCYLIRNGEYIRFELIEKYFESMTVNETNEITNKKKNSKKQCELESLQSQIDLGKAIETISNKKTHNINTKDVKDNRDTFIKNNNISRGDK